MEAQEGSRRVLLGRSFSNSPSKSSRRERTDGFSMGFSMSGTVLKVKNTFFEEDSDSVCDGGPMEITRSVSAPEGALSRHSAREPPMDSSPSATPMVHISELKFMEPAEELPLSPPACLPLPARSVQGCVSQKPARCRNVTLQDVDRHPSNSSTASAVSTVSADSHPQVIANAPFKIKNTFIDDFADDSSEETPVKSAKSCPARGRRSGSRSCLASISEKADPFRLAAGGSPGPCEPAAVAGFSAPAAVDTVFQRAELTSDNSATIDSATRVGVVPLEQRQPEWSLGAHLHEPGECKPCMWYWRPQGCKNASQCQHCHICPEGAVQERRKNRRQVTRSNASTSKCSLNLSALV